MLFLVIIYALLAMFLLFLAYRMIIAQEQESE